jgi:hypothetical protein
MLNILWVEDEYSEQKQQQWFKDRNVTVRTSFDAAEQTINSDLNRYDIVVLDINLENSETSENIKKYANYFGVSVGDFLGRSGMNLYFMLLEHGFPKDRIVFLTANADETTSQINDLRQAFNNGDDGEVGKLIEIITAGFSGEERTKSYSFIDKPDGYDESDFNSLCDYLYSCFNSLNHSQQKNTYEVLQETAKNCRIGMPRAFNKNTNQLDVELTRLELNKYLVLRRGVIDGCSFLKTLINSNPEKIQFTDFIKADNNHEITATEIENYLEAVAQSLSNRESSGREALNIQYRLFLRTLAHEWEENIEANGIKQKHGDNLDKVFDIYTYAWIMKMTRNWVSHANLLEPINPQFLAFLFLINMRSMFRLPKEIQDYEKSLLKIISQSIGDEINCEDASDKMKYADQLVDEYLASLRKDISEKHFGIKINTIYQHHTGNPDAEEYDFKKLLFQYFWINQRKYLMNLLSKSDEFMPVLARHVFSIGF